MAFFQPCLHAYSSTVRSPESLALLCKTLPISVWHPSLGCLAYGLTRWGTTVHLATAPFNCLAQVTVQVANGYLWNPPLSTLGEDSNVHVGTKNCISLVCDKYYISVFHQKSEEQRSYCTFVQWHCSCLLWLDICQKKDWCVVQCDTVLSGRLVPLKYWYLSTSLHIITPQKTIILIFTAMQTSNFQAGTMFLRNLKFHIVCTFFNMSHFRAC